jgi:hypothetical protein
VRRRWRSGRDHRAGRPGEPLRRGVGSPCAAVSGAPAEGEIGGLQVPGSRSGGPGGGVWNGVRRSDRLWFEAGRGEARRLNPHRARPTAKRLSSTRFYPEGRRSRSEKRHGLPALRIKPSSLDGFTWREACCVRRTSDSTWAARHTAVTSSASRIGPPASHGLIPARCGGSISTHSSRPGSAKSRPN